MNFFNLNKYRNCYFALIFLAAIILIPSGSKANPNPDDISIDAVYGFNGFFKMNTPSPVTVEVSNTGDLFDGWVVANLESWVPPTYYKTPLALPPGSSKSIVFASYGCADSSMCEIPIEIYGDSGTPLKIIYPDKHPLYSYDTLMIHLGDSGGSLENLYVKMNPGYMIMSAKNVVQGTSLLQYSPRVFAVDMDVDELPTDVLLCESVNTIAMEISDYLGLSDEKKDLIVNIVNNGASLILYPGDTTSANVDLSAEVYLPATFSGGTGAIDSGEFALTVKNQVLSAAYAVTMPSHSSLMDRSQYGANYFPNQVTDLNGYPIRQVPAGALKWSLPDTYEISILDPEPGTDVTYSTNSNIPLLVSRDIGVGRIAITSYNPWINAPSAQDDPVMLLATHGLLNPVNIPQMFISPALQQFRNTNDSQIAGYFTRGFRDSNNGVVAWMESVGTPVLVYLLGLPLLVYIGRGKGGTILVLFIVWSVVLTVATIAYQTFPTGDKVTLNRASIFWCDASPEIFGTDKRFESRVFQYFTYGSESISARTVDFEGDGTIVDEVVDPYRWPYGDVTIEQGQTVSLPDLPLEPTSYNSMYRGWREFMLRRYEPDLSASGQIEVASGVSTVSVEFDLPFDVDNGLLLIDDMEIWLDPSVIKSGKIDYIITGDGLSDFSMSDRATSEVVMDFSEYRTRVATGSSRFEGVLEKLVDFTWSAIAFNAGKYAQSKYSGRQSNAYFLTGANFSPDDISLGSGNLELHGISALVISIPIIYQE